MVLLFFLVGSIWFTFAMAPGFNVAVRVMVLVTFNSSTMEKSENKTGKGNGKLVGQTSTMDVNQTRKQTNK